MTTCTIDPKTIVLKSGAHPCDDGLYCVMEADSCIARGVKTDHDETASPVISSFLRNWNDSIKSDDDRSTLLRQFIGRVSGTKGSDEVENRRAWMAADWIVREFAPAWLDMVPALAVHAAALRATPEIVGLESLAPSAHLMTAAAKDAAAARAAAWAAARAAAWAAARDAARDAAGAAAGDAAWDAAWAAARAAAGAAAWAAAWDAAGDAAQAAAWAHLKPTVSKLQISAQQLVERMLAA